MTKAIGRSDRLICARNIKQKIKKKTETNKCKKRNEIHKRRKIIHVL